MAGLLTLHRYYIWANRMRTHFDAVLSQGMPVGTVEIESFLYMSYWYGALYVVIEGWRELKIGDTDIDGLLQSPNVDLLRRYRNGTFHFQKAYYDERFIAFMREGIDCAAWVRSLTEQFGSYFLSQPREPESLT